MYLLFYEKSTNDVKFKYWKINKDKKKQWKTIIEQNDLVGNTLRATLTAELNVSDLDAYTG